MKKQKNKSVLRSNDAKKKKMCFFRGSVLLRESELTIVALESEKNRFC